MMWFSRMKFKNVGSFIDRRSTNGRPLSSWLNGLTSRVVACSLFIQLATNRNWLSPPMPFIKGNRRTSFNWSIFNFKVKRRGMSVDSSGRQALMSVEQLVERAKPQIPLTLSREMLKFKLERKGWFFQQDWMVSTPIWYTYFRMRNWMHVFISVLHSRLWANRKMRSALPTVSSTLPV